MIVSKLIARNWAPKYQRTDWQLIVEGMSVLLGFAFVAFLGFLALKLAWIVVSFIIAF
jgi:hypothetical protein